MRKLNVIELYGGIGRCSAPFLGWRRAKVALLADWNSHAADVYLHNHPSRPYLVADLNEVTASGLEANVDGRVDVVLGCPPCQGFSQSGKRDRSDPRNAHVLNFMRLAIGLHPLAIAMENVPLAALSPEFHQATEMLDQAGYRWTAGLLNAAEYGSAQTRNRLVLIAIHKRVGVEPVIQSPSHQPCGTYFDYNAQRSRTVQAADDSLLGITASVRRVYAALQPRLSRRRKVAPTPCFEDVMQGLPRIGTASARVSGHVPWPHTARTLEKMEKIPEGGRLHTNRSYYGAAYARLHRKGLARTLTTFFPNAGSGRFWHPTANRAITLREAARLQGVPDAFYFPGGACPANAMLLGNALDMSLARATYWSVRSALESAS
jgi:DNA (cytosine-5)-methyltransferase 1